MENDDLILSVTPSRAEPVRRLLSAPNRFERTFGRHASSNNALTVLRGSSVRVQPLRRTLSHDLADTTQIDLQQPLIPSIPEGVSTAAGAPSPFAAVAAPHDLEANSTAADTTETLSQAGSQSIGIPVGNDDLDDFEQRDAKEAIAVNLSLGVNIVLFIAKLYAVVATQSLSVAASLADSVVDLLSQVVITICAKATRNVDPRFPIGKSRMETVGVVLCAVIMSLASTEVIESSAGTLWDGFRKGILPDVQLDLTMYIILGSATGLKVIAFSYCIALAKQSVSIAALAEDHRNDVLSNSTAILTATIASNYQKVWWVDPVGAILISAYIIFSWVFIMKDQLQHLVGRGAPDEFLHFLQQLANTHNERLYVDVVRAYHFGQRYIVELEVVMPAEMTVQTSHDIALTLQHKVEAIEEVERAFVHVDYAHRDEPEHKVERNLVQGSKDLFKPHDSVAAHRPHFASASSGTLDSPHP